MSTNNNYELLSKNNRHPDPLISRLILNDEHGKQIKDQRQAFRECKVVGFLFSMNWRYDPKAFQTHVVQLCLRNPHRFKCIYVSVDSCKEDFDRATKDKPWFNMIWEDGSNVEEDSQVKPQLDFITPMEPERIKRIFWRGAGDHKREEEDDDGRPLSRVGLCAGAEVLYAPTLMIYHVESGRWLERCVAAGVIETREKREEALERWERGESLGVTWTDILVGLRWAILFSSIGLIYCLLVRFDDAYNVVHLVERFMAGSSSPSTATPPPPPPPPPITTSVPSHHYAEF